MRRAFLAFGFLGLLSCPASMSQGVPDAGFGTTPLPSEPTNTQAEQVPVPGAEPLAPPGATAPTGSQGPGSRNLPNLPKVTTGLISRPGTEIKDLPGARYGILSEPGGLESVPPARYATLSDGKGSGNVSPGPGQKSSSEKKSVPGTLEPARYAVLSDGAGKNGLDAAAQDKKSRASEGF